jgi:hypothetical protein
MIRSRGLQTTCAGLAFPERAQAYATQSDLSHSAQ